MISTAQILFFFSALGAFNGLFLSLYFALLKHNILQHRLLAALILMLTLRISKSIWFYFNPELGKIFLQIGLSACLLIGPLLYCYIKSCLNPNEHQKQVWPWHIGAYLCVIIVIGVLYPYQTNVELWGVFYRIINWLWAAYIALAAYLLYPKLSAHFRAKKRLSRPEVLCTNVAAGTALIWLAFFTSSYTSYIIGALSFSVIMYLSVLVWLFSKAAKPDASQTKPYANKTINKAVEQQLSARLHGLMAGEALYKDANLTLPVLAKKVGVSVPQLSQLLNDNMQKSFALYVNEWRINEAKRLLLQEARKSMEVIAEASGFNSQSTFYNAFKQLENTTPAKFRKVHQQELGNNQ